MNHLTTMTLLEKGNRKVHLTPIRMAVHSPCSIMEAASPEGNLYQLYFHRQQFLAAKKVTRSKRGSYLELAMTKGIVFLCPHPVVSQYITRHEKVKNRSLTELYSYSKKHFSPLEVSQIFRCMDSVIQAEKLFKVMREAYYEYRRDGKWGKAYAVLLTIEEAFPTHDWTASTKHDASFTAYHKKYSTVSDSLLKNDPTTCEWMLWKDRQNESSRKKWLDSYSQEPVFSTAAFAFLYENHQRETDETIFPLFLNEARKQFSPHEIKDLLLQMSTSGQEVISREAFRQCIRTEAFDEAITTLINHPFSLAAQDIRSLKEIIPQVKWDNRLPIEQLSMVLIPILKDEKKDLDSLLTACIPTLSKTHGLSYLIDWLKPLEDSKCSLPIYQKVKKLVAYAEDPDKQAKAGALYYELGLKREAIEAFSYEMELNPDDPSPVKWLFTLYRETGNLDEASAYKQLLQSMS
ncbi:tetratricopeptide repeat protein [Jeotgalibacillus proteolyticus]|uniref:Uncharacterized protein n=1 Tax=Jeotgalibacillus proteolyticus TaxID=2082395 RepID=A0A2S5G9Q5_9BACL|nr:hypothetical protein [Jeotgalibacillus proteolyticus]PPA69730.1 hypothetical protein C4B60_14415 [Jeotgalibacillus proteolyticus]